MRLIVPEVLNTLLLSQVVFCKEEYVIFIK